MEKNSIIKQTSTINRFEIVPDTLKKLIAQDLGLDESSITIQFCIEEVGGDPLDRYPGTNTVTKIVVTETKKIK